MTFHRSLEQQGEGRGGEEDGEEGEGVVIRFYERRTGDQSWYSVLGEHATMVATQYFKTTSTLKHLSGDLPCQNVQLSQFLEIARDLVTRHRFRLEVYRASSSASSGWERFKKASPGDMEALADDDDEDLASSQASITFALCLGPGQRVGLAYCDKQARQFRVREFADDEHFSSLESAFVQVAGARECCLAVEKGSPEHRKVANILEACNVKASAVKRTDLRSDDIEQDLGRLLEGGDVRHSLAELELALAMRALGCLIRYLELLNDPHNFGQFRLRQLDLSFCLRLDAAAAKALSLAPLPHEADGRKEGTLYGLLNQCRTAMGSRLLMRWIKQPLLNLPDILDRQRNIELFVEEPELRRAIYDDLLRRVPDLSRLSRKFERKQAKLADCVRLGQFVERCQPMSRVFSGYSGPFRELAFQQFAEPLQHLTASFEPYIQMIRETIDPEALLRHEYLILPTFDDQLLELYNSRVTIEEQIHAHLREVARKLHSDTELKSLQLIKAPIHGYVFKVSKNDEKKLRTKKAAVPYTELDVRKDGVKFQTPLLARLSTQYDELTERYNKCQAHLATRLVEVAEGYTSPLLLMTEVVTELDIFATLATVFSDAPAVFCKPTLLPLDATPRAILIEEGRHPCVEALLVSDASGAKFIPNSTELRSPDSTFHIITGPNMGGKSTYIRQVGLITLMAQMGCYVPAASATVSMVDSILCRVGASDSQLRGVSTFMAEMLETSAIIRTATKNSLVIIDELGRGTSTYDGFGLAWAIAEHIATKIGAFALFATHFHELTALEQIYPCFQNYHVTADTSNNSLTLLDHLQRGACDRSFGIHVAEMANFPPSVVAAARRKAAELEDFSDGPATSSSSATPSSTPSSTPLVDDEDEMVDSLGKRQRVITPEERQGEQLIKAFLQEFSSIPLAELSPEEVAAVLGNMKVKIESANNPFVNLILSTHQ